MFQYIIRLYIKPLVLDYYFFFELLQSNNNNSEKRALCTIQYLLKDKFQKIVFLFEIVLQLISDIIYNVITIYNIKSIHDLPCVSKFFTPRQSSNLEAVPGPLLSISQPS